MQDESVNTTDVQVEEQQEQQQEPVDARIRLLSDNGDMTVEIEVEAPIAGGLDVTLEDLQAALSREGVVYGIDEAVLERLAAPAYDKRMVVAKGTPAQDGEDGQVKELFEHQAARQQIEREDGTVDYRESGLVRDIKPGTLICEIAPPTKGVDGTNTKGKPVKARDGQKAVPLVGENIAVNEEGTKATSTIGGNLVFRNGRFTVDTVVRVEHVNYDVGNITFSGDVQVSGDVSDGFEIRAGGTVTLHGQAGAVVIQAQNIVIDKGINGTGRAELEAADTLKAGFIENCNIHVGEKLIAQSVINCQVECEGDVEVTGGKGIICGGKITAFGSVQAKEVGNDFNTLTVITLGVTPKLLKERKRLVEQIEDVRRHMDELNKNAAYIEKLVADGRPVPEERVSMLKRAQIQLPLSQRKAEQLQKGLDELEEKLAQINNVTLTARVLHPPTKVTIGTVSGNLTETRKNCRVFRNSEGELVFGSTGAS